MAVAKVEEKVEEVQKDRSELAKERRAKMAELRAALELQEKEEEVETDALIQELEEAISAWGVREVTPRLDFILEKYGFQTHYVGLFRKEVQTEILKRINTSTNPDKTTELGQEEIDQIAKLPGINCDSVDIRRTIKVMVNGGLIATWNPDKKKGRNSTYCLAPVSKPNTPVDPATIRGAASGDTSEK